MNQVSPLRPIFFSSLHDALISALRMGRFKTSQVKLVWVLILIIITRSRSYETAYRPVTGCVAQSLKALFFHSFTHSITFYSFLLICLSIHIIFFIHMFSLVPWHALFFWCKNAWLCILLAIGGKYIFIEIILPFLSLKWKTTMALGSNLFEKSNS